MGKGGEKPPESERVVFGRNFKAARVARGLETSEVAEACQMAYGRLVQIEAGEVNITIDKMAKLARVVGCDVVELLTDQRGAGGKRRG